MLVTTTNRHVRLIWDRLIPSWPLLLGLAVSIRPLIESAPILNDPDTYLHIATGRWILSHGILPSADPFSHSLPGAPWVPHEWASELVLAIAFGLGGWNGLILLSVTCFAVSIAVLAHLLLRYFEPFSALFLTVAGAAVLMHHLLARPHILILPLLVIWCGALFAARDSGRAPSLYLAGIMVVWANLHGSFMSGLVIAGFLGTEAVLLPGMGQTRWSEARRWGGFVVIVGLAALLTPNRIDGFMQPFRLLATPMLQTVIIEWRNPEMAQFPALEIWIVGMFCGALAFGLRTPAPRLLLIGTLLFETFQHERHADLLVTVAPLAAAATLGPQLAAQLRAPPRSMLAGVFERLTQPASGIAVSLTIMLGVTLGFLGAWRPFERSVDAVTPAAALAAARSMNLVGPVFNAYAFGGYLVFEGVPTFIDGRVEFYGNDFLTEAYQAASGNYAVLNELLVRYRITWTMLIAGSEAARAMSRLQGWEQVYADDTAVIHRRVDTGSRSAPMP